jgi:hypothetical protein
MSMREKKKKEPTKHNKRALATTNRMRQEGDDEHQ